MQIYGRLEAFCETGTVGIVWSVTDRRLPGYDGLWPLQYGDHIEVLDADDETVWQGVIKLEYANRLDAEHGQQHLAGYWVHGLQDGMDPETWGKLLRVILHPTTVLPGRAEPHPFLGPSETMAARLAALSSGRQQELYRVATYPWLYFFSNGQPFSLAIEHWGFTLEDTCRLIGAPTVAQLDAGKHYPKSATATLMPFDFDRLVRIALLYGVYGGLDWNFPTPEARLAWLNAGTPSRKELLLSGIIAPLRDAVAIQLA